MTRASAVALALTALLVVTACADNILKERPANSAAKRTAAAAPKFAVTTKGQSSVCAAYRRQLAQVKREQGNGRAESPCVEHAGPEGKGAVAQRRDR